MIHLLFDVAASPLVVTGLLLIAGLYFATPARERLLRAVEVVTPTPDFTPSPDVEQARRDLRAKAWGGEVE